MVLAGGARLPNFLEDGVLVWRIIGGQARQRGKLGVTLGAHVGFLVAQGAAARSQGGELLALLRGRSAFTTAACAVLFGTKLLELRRNRPPALIELEYAIDGRGYCRTPSRERLAHGVRVAADQSDVEDAGS